MPPYAKLRPTNLSDAAYEYKPRLTPPSYWDKFKNYAEDIGNYGSEMAEGLGTKARSVVRGLLPGQSDVDDVMSVGLNPLELPAGAIAGMIVPKQLWQSRIDKIVEGMKRQHTNMDNIPRAESFTNSMERFMRELHPEMAAHINKIDLLNTTQADNLMGKGIAGSYGSSIKHPRWPESWRPDTRDLRGNTGKFSRVDRLEQAKEIAAEMADDPNHPWLSEDAAFFDDIIDNRIRLKETDEWADPSKMFETPRHEMGHGAQDMGFTRQYDKELKSYKESNTKPHLYPQQPMEIGARVSERKAKFDAQRLYSAEKPTIEPASQLWKEEIQSGANRSMRALTKGTGKNTLMHIQNQTIPDINRALKFKRPIEGTLLKPDYTRHIDYPTGENWHRQAFDWGKHGKYSLFVDEAPIGMTIDELIARGFLK